MRRASMEFDSKEDGNNLTVGDTYSLRTQSQGFFFATEGAAKMAYGYPTPGPQNPKPAEVMDHVYFLSPDQWRQACENADYNLIIVGTGPCGLAVAARALENDPFTKILMVERGDFFLPQHFQNLSTSLSNTLGGKSETFPWTCARSTALGFDGPVTWNHGSVPFFGGKSTLWSSWCPKPTRKEMSGWPAQTIQTVHDNFDAACKLLNVQRADEVDGRLTDEQRTALSVLSIRPIYDKLQHTIQGLLAEAVESNSLTSIYRAEAAPLASSGQSAGLDFMKYATPGPLLELINKTRELEENEAGAALSIVINCVVERILHQDGFATALQTSRGVLPVGNAQLVLAMGPLPPTTLIQQSFPRLPNIGSTLSAHFITSIVARVPKAAFDESFGPLELAACYVAGVVSGNYDQQFHVQLTALADENPEDNAQVAQRYMPDVVATASKEQMITSTNHIVFVCAVLGELGTMDSSFLPNPDDKDPTTASMLRIISNDEKSLDTWDGMDEATFEMLETVLAPNGAEVEYWHAMADGQGVWATGRPSTEQRRVPAIVHESSTMPLGEGQKCPVDLDYRLKKTQNVYVTGGALWPRGGSWNPTPTMVAMAIDLVDQIIPKEVN